MKFLLPTCLLFAACSGGIDKAGDDDDSGGGKVDPVIDDVDKVVSKECQTVKPGAAPLRRLSNDEYRNTLIDLMGMNGDVDKAAAQFSKETESLGFRNNAEFLGVSAVITDAYMRTADDLSIKAAANSSFVKCDNPGDKAACGKQFIRDFGERAYRRPLDTDEKAAYDKVFTDTMGKYDYQTGIEWVIYSMLQSSNFLFRVEFGGEPLKGGHTRPSDYEMASRLSYLLWQSMPDEDLFIAAREGKLSTAAEVRAQAERMLQDSKADRSLEFFRQWLDADTLDSYSRDAAVFKNLPANLKNLFAGELDAFTRSLMFENDGTFKDLISAEHTFVNADLAKHYGLDGDFDNTYQRVDRPGTAGFLTMSGFLTAHDKPTRTSIVLRGTKIRTDVMCQLVPAPPNNVELKLDSIGPGLSQKDRLALHREEPTCAGCHELIDPVGVTFEGFDAVGRQRTLDEDGLEIDTSTTLTQSFDVDGDLSGPVEMGKVFAESDQMRQCYVSQTFRFFYGRDYDEEDNCSRAQITKAFVDSKFNLREALLAMTQTNAFLYRPASN